jgi:hypothetical protein
MKLLGNPAAPTPPPQPEPLKKWQKILFGGTGRDFLGSIGDSLAAQSSVLAGGGPPAIGAHAMQVRQRQMDQAKLMEDYNSQVEQRNAGQEDFKRQIALQYMQGQIGLTNRNTIGPLDESRLALDRARAAETERHNLAIEGKVTPPDPNAAARLAETNRHNVAMEKLGGIRNAKTGKPLDTATRNLLENANTGEQFAKEALIFFNTEAGGSAGGPVAGHMPTMILPKSTNEFNTLRIKAEAQLRKYLAGSNVTTNEMIELTPLLVGLTGTPDQIRNSMTGIADFFGRKKQTLLQSLESTGVSPEAADETRKMFGYVDPQSEALIQPDNVIRKTVSTGRTFESSDGGKTWTLVP